MLPPLSLYVRAGVTLRKAVRQSSQGHAYPPDQEDEVAGAGMHYLPPPSALMLAANILFEEIYDLVFRSSGYIHCETT